MRKLSALLIVMSALALLVIWMPGRDSERQLAVVTEIADKGFARVRAPSDRLSNATSEQPGGERRSRSFSPDVPLVPTDRPTARKEVAAPAAPDPRSSTASTGELRVASGVRQPASPSASRLTTTLPADESSRYELVRSLQRELKRVGCYWGEIDGSWGGGSKRAMGAFMERVNSALPVEQPDYILLSLLQGHTGQACGKGCPAGQTMADAGRCVPNVVLAQTTKRPPTREQAPAQQRVAPADGWAATVQPTPPEPTYAPTVATAPLPGRMSIGGPRSGDGVTTDPSGLSSSARPSTAYVSPGRVASKGRASSRPVVIYRAARPSYSYYRPAPRTASRRLSFGDVFR